jgi:hypothetical protein
MVLSDLFIFVMGLLVTGVVVAAVAAIGLQEREDFRERDEGDRQVEP